MILKPLDAAFSDVARRAIKAEDRADVFQQTAREKTTDHEMTRVLRVMVAYHHEADRLWGRVFDGAPTDGAKHDRRQVMDG